MSSSLAVRIYKGEIFQNGPAPIEFYVDVVDDAVTFTPRAILQADISTISYTIYDNNGVALFSDVSLSPVSSYIYNTVQTGPEITFNFRVVIPASKFATAGTYLVRFKFVLVSLTASPIFAEYRLTALKT